MNVHNRQALNANLRETLQQTELIPPLSETANKLLQLRNRQDANLEELVSVIEDDPSLAAFVMKYARMAIFGYGDRITSVTYAVSLVLGYTTALNVTLGVASSGSLKMPDDGPLGRVRLWKDALQCAQLCRQLCRLMKKEQCIDPDLAYLGGLLHNFGYLLVGHVCPREFASLNEMMAHNPEQDIRPLELQQFGITHDLVGLYLLKAWRLPEEVIMMAAKHHYPDSVGKHVIYVKVVATANRLLHKDCITDACEHIETSALLEELGIGEAEAGLELEQVLAIQDELEELARGLMA
ncbi:HD-like signal output (HDOD) domain, no enzymatic activity [Nitrosomonas sp. Nm51]|uniref:HDOD domain-containing protein n=1 Tax=Nitrosomonas sp. Nm51 TaxID=133720 RepID=UPI0008B6D9E7|nr:HDOD domain-containing protein [Nitrosomonas sp. Nm51]SER37917.1 HD-like signal output (HDOD) domain, no enzymatic activity [Nitrosomonas sp. Nm51]